MARPACCSWLWAPGRWCRNKLTTTGKQFFSMGLIRCLVVFSTIMIIVLIIFATQLARHRGVVIALSVVCFISLSLLLYKLVQTRRILKQSLDEEKAAWESRERRLQEGDSCEDDPEEEVDDLLRAISGVPARLKLQELEKATCGFRKLLGRGGFGSVYEGELADGTKVAVKRLETEGKLRSKEFCAEVVTISGIHHVNLVRLLGFCVEGSQRLLVYEFMQNGSLDKWLFSKSSSHNELEKQQMKKKLADLEEDQEVAAAAEETLSLSWFVRFRIAVETACALAYLHEECRETILHLDVKPQNILLDEEFHAKVSDFGLSRAIAREQSRLVTSMRGTPGYLAPEWLVHAGVTKKSDVYSYGMVLLELVSGRRNVDHSRDSNSWYFPMLAFCCAQEMRMHDIVDPILRDVPGGMAIADMAQAQLAIRIAFWCIQDHMASRPTMSNVVRMLEGNLPVVDPPLTSVFSFTNVLALGPSIGAIPCFPHTEQRQDQHQEHVEEPPLQCHRPPMLQMEEPFSISIGSSTPNSPLPPPPCR